MGRLQAQAQAPLGEFFRSLELTGSPLFIAPPTELPNPRLHRLYGFLGVDAQIDRNVAGVAMLLHEAVHVVRDPESLADVEEQARAHPLPEQRVQQVDGVSVRM